MGHFKLGHLKFKHIIFIFCGEFGLFVCLFVRVLGRVDSKVNLRP